MRILDRLIDTRPLRSSRPFRRLWIGTTASSFGGQMTMVAVLFQVWEITGSPLLVGASSALYLPHFRSGRRGWIVFNASVFALAYVAAAYVVFVALIVAYVAIMAAKLARIERALEDYDSNRDEPTR